jgi:alanyl-tRNA synthetase
MNKARQEFIEFFLKNMDINTGPLLPMFHTMILPPVRQCGHEPEQTFVLGNLCPSLEMSTLTRAVTSQKCIRAGGKHNDFDGIGKDVHHDTFFE